MRETIGNLALLVIWIVSTCTLFFTNIVIDRIVAFAGISIICVAILIFGDKLTTFSLRALGIELEATVEKARASAEQIETLRKDAEARLDSIQEQMDKVEQLAQSARKLTEMGF